MKTMKVALLATAALAAVSVSARADDAAAIKAQLEALTARIAQLEAGPALPVGYSLLAMSEVEQFTLTGEKASDVSATSTANRISILPTADAPATASITWSAEIRAALTHQTNVPHVITTTTTTVVSTTYDDDTTMKARGRIRAQAKTETSVGEVGVDIRLQGTSEFGGSGATATMNIAWGWWAMTPEWTLGGGYTGTLSDPGHGMDSLAQFGTTIYFGAQGDQEQMRLTYASGPLTWAIALEDSENHVPGVGGEHTQLAVASRINYSGDAFSASLAGYYAPDAPGGMVTTLGDDYWQVAAGATIPLADIATFSANAAINSEDDFGATAYVSFDLTEATFFEASAGHIWADAASSDVTKYNAGIYWKPVDQLKIGLQADHIDDDALLEKQTSVSLVTWFSY
jgi:hypothetical protein